MYVWRAPLKCERITLEYENNDQFGNSIFLQTFMIAMSILITVQPKDNNYRIKKKKKTHLHYLLHEASTKNHISPIPIIFQQMKPFNSKYRS